MVSKRTEKNVALIVTIGLTLLLIMVVNIFFFRDVNSSTIFFVVIGLGLLLFGLILKRKYKISFPIKQDNA